MNKSLTILAFSFASQVSLGLAQDGPAAFDYLFKVATHPRCVNCHGILSEGKHIPTIGEDRKPPAMNVSSHLPSLGTPCTACHQKKNFPEAGYPPGAANDLMPGFLWHMPPPSMIIRPGLTKKELCQLWTDPKRNSKVEGGRGSLADLATFEKEFVHHVTDDPLIHWAFDPGPGRTPAPGSREQLISAMKTWIGWLKQGNNCNNLL